MVKRLLSLVALALCLALFAGASARGDDKERDKGDWHEGTVVSMTGDKLTMKHKDGGEEHSHTLAPEAEIMIDGRKSDVATFRDLKPGTKIKVMTKKGDKTVALKIKALDKNTEFDKDTGTDKNRDK